jgi:hypothetical protein
MAETLEAGLSQSATTEEVIAGIETVPCGKLSSDTIPAGALPPRPPSSINAVAPSPTAATPAATPRSLWRRLPVEAKFAVVFSCIFLVGVAAGLPINLPDGPSLVFVQKHYFAPLLMALGLQVVVAYFSGRRHQGDPYLLVKLAPFVALTIFLHFNFKAWMPLINPFCFDPFYQHVDDVFEPVLNALLWTRATIGDLSPVNLDSGYHTLFVGMFFVSVSAHALFDRPGRLRQLVLGMCLILLLGGVAYWVTPALGPFIYRDGVNELAREAQGYMLHQFLQLVATGEIPPGYFIAAPAAMPSLHIAHSLFLTAFAWRSLRWLAILYIPIFLWIMLGSVGTAWHYLADLPAGALLAIYCLRLVRRLVPVPA